MLKETCFTTAMALGMFFLIKPTWIYTKATVVDLFARREYIIGIISSIEKKEDYSGEGLNIDYIINIENQSLKIPKHACHKLKKGIVYVLQSPLKCKMCGK